MRPEPCEPAPEVGDEVLVTQTSLHGPPRSWRGVVTELHPDGEFDFAGHHVGSGLPVEGSARYPEALMAPGVVETVQVLRRAVPVHVDWYGQVRVEYRLPADEGVPS